MPGVYIEDDEMSGRTAHRKEMTSAENFKRHMKINDGVWRVEWIEIT
jgi:hypothetical protein